MEPPLSIENLTVAVDVGGSRIEAVRDVSLSVGPGEIVGVVGESGAGKTLLAQSVPRLLPAGASVESGRIEICGRELRSSDERVLREIRGNLVGFVSQDAPNALNPVLTIGFQIREAICAHRRLSRARARAEAVDLLDAVAMPDPTTCLSRYPHELSGGQRQRVAIAMALAGQPRLLIADEATTSLDVTVQAQLMELLGVLNTERGLAILLVTHDLALVSETCHRVVVMLAGQVVEEGSVRGVLGSPGHPYTAALVDSATGSKRSPESLPREEGSRLSARSKAGCSFLTRCPLSLDRCKLEEPTLRSGVGGSAVRCFVAQGEVG